MPDNHLAEQAADEYAESFAGGLTLEALREAFRTGVMWCAVFDGSIERLAAAEKLAEAVRLLLAPAALNSTRREVVRRVVQRRLAAFEASGITKEGK